MNRIVNSFVRTYASFHHKRMHNFRTKPLLVQQQAFRKILRAIGDSEYASNHGIDKGSTISNFKNQLPISDYETLSPYIKRMMKGEDHVLCSDKVNWFAKSSGTTGEKSKYIPVTNAFMKTCYTTSNWDVVGLLYNYKKDLKIFSSKNLIMGGTLERLEEYPNAIVGDVSAILLENMPGFAKWCYTPDFETALMNDWDQKLEKMAETCTKEKVVLFAGVPTWTLVLFNKLIERYGVESILDIWPDAMVYLHGGVGFEPYRNQFIKLFPKKDFIYAECYNASEGYFAVQDDFHSEGMLLLLDNSVFYEFIPEGQLDSENPDLLGLEDIEQGKTYSMVITTSSGLWRYQLGDLVQFISIYPFKIKVAGRTKQHINVFGEELMIHNTDQAISAICSEMNAQIKEYTVAPIFMTDNSNGGHEWLIEFEKPPLDLDKFANRLDLELQRRNSDYEAKRFNDIALRQLVIHQLPLGTFENWQRDNGKYGGQFKVQRLSNNRTFLEEILKYKNVISV